MDKELISGWLNVRITVGYLGEEARHNWWPSKFYADWSPTFLDPLFPKTAHLARYHGVLEAGRRTHDTFIGVGSVFHLFRLPEEIEQALHELAESDKAVKIAESLSDKTDTLRSLYKEQTDSRSIAEGPVLIGNMADIFSKGGLKLLSERYFSAFSNGVRTYPYFLAK